MAELTQEQLDELISEKVKEAKAGLFDENELQRRVTAEVDRRVESGIQKGLDTQRAKWEAEFKQKAQMTAEELAKQQLEEQSKELSAKEREINRRANLADAKDMLSDANIPKSQYEKFISMLVTEELETTKANVENFINMFNSTKTELETEIKTKLSGVPAPKQGEKGGVMTKKEFDKLGYAEKLKFKGEQPELYKEFMK